MRSTICDTRDKDARHMAVEVENGKLWHLLSQVLPIAMNCSTWCCMCGYVCDIKSRKCKWFNSVLEEAEELGIEVGG